MLEPNRNYVIDTDGNIHKMLFVGDCDWDEKSVSSLQEVRADAIREFADKLQQEFRREYENHVAVGIESCVNWAVYLDATIKQALAEMQCK